MSGKGVVEIWIMAQVVACCHVKNNSERQDEFSIDYAKNRKY